MESRTIEDFVDDMIWRGRSLNEIKVVAQCTHWHSKIPEILTYAKNFEKLLKKN